jgi:hypothetical protein
MVEEILLMNHDTICLLTVTCSLQYLLNHDYFDLWIEITNNFFEILDESKIK